ncbi:MAG: hypothetical protein CR991_10580, partial [Proteobacteria bacterium]
NLAALYYLMGEYTQALPLCESALATQERVLGQEHPDVAQTLNNLGIVYLGMDQYNESAAYLKRALSIYELKLGAEHPDTQNTKRSLAAVLDKLK